MSGKARAPAARGDLVQRTVEAATSGSSACRIPASNRPRAMVARRHRHRHRRADRAEPPRTARCKKTRTGSTPRRASSNIPCSMQACVIATRAIATARRRTAATRRESQLRAARVTKAPVTDRARRRRRRRSACRNRSARLVRTFSPPRRTSPSRRATPATGRWPQDELQKNVRGRGPGRLPLQGRGPLRGVGPDRRHRGRRLSR